MPSSVWRLRIINLTISQPDVTHLKPIIVVATPTEGGIFFATCAESLGKKICRDFNLNLKDVLWIEKDPFHAARLQVAKFKLKSFMGTESIYAIEWRPIRPNEMGVIKSFMPEAETNRLTH